MAKRRNNKELLFQRRPCRCGARRAIQSRNQSPTRGSLDQVSTLAHELGHAFHNECLRARTPLNRDTPMTLAETASVFGEFLVFDYLLAAERDPRVQVIELSRNFGKEAALTAGLDAAQGDAVIPIDADLQDPPELIGRCLQKLREGWDVVYTVRRKRKENLLRRFKVK